MATVNIEDLTFGEKLLITRRREGHSQQEVAEFLGMTRNRYGKIERDDEDHYGIAVRDVEELSIEEICFLLRRRKGLTQQECAAELGVTRFWFNQMEIGKAPSTNLAEFWELAI